MNADLKMTATTVDKECCWEHQHDSAGPCHGPSINLLIPPRHGAEQLAIVRRIGAQASLVQQYCQLCRVPTMVRPEGSISLCEQSCAASSAVLPPSSNSVAIPSAILPLSSISHPYASHPKLSSFLYTRLSSHPTATTSAAAAAAAAPT